MIPSQTASRTDCSTGLNLDGSGRPIEGVSELASFQPPGPHSWGEIRRLGGHPQTLCNGTAPLCRLQTCHCEPFSEMRDEKARQSLVPPLVSHHPGIASSLCSSQCQQPMRNPPSLSRQPSGRHSCANPCRGEFDARPHVTPQFPGGTPPAPRRGRPLCLPFSCHSREACPRENGERESRGHPEPRQHPAAPVCHPSPFVKGGFQGVLGTGGTPKPAAGRIPFQTATVEYHARSMRTGGCLEFGEAPL